MARHRRHRSGTHRVVSELRQGQQQEQGSSIFPFRWNPINPKQAEASPRKAEQLMIVLKQS